MATWAVANRPARFADVTGQFHVSDLLRGMARAYHNDAMVWPPALVFYGPRGTGKTTMARIVSAALNCLDPQDGEPCLECASCKAIRTGTSPGVTELDMASNGSVDGVRSIRDRASFSMSPDNFTVYLLDEVHSASREAFNALLKILEEPPPGLLFVLVTTDPESIPDTVRSRAMEYEFRRLSPLDISERLRHVAAVQGVADRIDDAVYHLLAVRARGGMRDAVMSLEQCCYQDGPVTADTVRTTFGVSDLPERLLDAAVKGDAARGFAVLQEAALSAVPVQVLITEMLDGLTALLASVVDAAVPSLGTVSDEWVETYAGGIPATNVVAGIGVLWDLQSRTHAGDVSAASTLAAGYALLVDAISPGSFSVIDPLADRQKGNGTVIHSASPTNGSAPDVPIETTGPPLTPAELGDLVAQLAHEFRIDG